jgi:hypothetical protein
MSRLEPNLLEEGLLLHVGERMLDGEHLYRDIALISGPVPYAMVAGLFALFGPSVAAARAGIVVLHALACGAVYGLARHSGAGPWAHASAAALAAAPALLFPLPSTTFYATMSSTLALVVAWLALRGVGSARWGFAAGVAIALTALSKQTVGALLAITLVPAVTLCAPSGRRLIRGASVCGGGVVVAVLTLTLFAALGDLEVFARSLVTTPRSGVFDSPFINLWPPGKLAPEIFEFESLYLPEVFYILSDGRLHHPPAAVLLTQVLYALAPFALALTLARRLLGPLPAGVWMFAGACIACASNLFPRADAGHLAFAAPAAVAYAFCLGPAFAAPALAARGAVARIGAGAAILALAGATLWVGTQLYALAGEPSWGPRVDVPPVSPPKRASAVPRVIHYLRDRLEPGEAIFVARTEPLLYFATGARNPTPFTGLLQVWGLRGEQQDEILRVLEQIRFVVMSDIDEPIHTFYRDELPRVQAELERRFHVPPVFTGRERIDDWILVLERGADRGPTLIDLSDPELSPRAWVRGPDGALRPAPPPETRVPTRHNRRPLAMALGARGGGADWEIRVPERARFQAALGLRQVHGWRQPKWLRFEVKVSEGGGFRTLASQTLRFEAGSGEGRRWQELDVDLSALAGRRVTLRLDALTARSPRAGQVALWGSPRIAGAPEQGAAPVF